MAASLHFGLWGAVFVSVYLTSGQLLEARDPVWFKSVFFLA